jgi:hypothetical protein
VPLGMTDHLGRSLATQTAFLLRVARVRAVCFACHLLCRDRGLVRETPDVTRPSPEELLRTPDALLTRTDLRDLGLHRRAVDAVFRALPVVVLPGYSRPLVRAADYLALVEQSTYDETRVRP